jgi:signal transduction histidine kinase
MRFVRHAPPSSFGNGFDSSFMPQPTEDSRGDNARASWIEAHLIHNFFTNARFSLRSLCVALFVTLLMLYGQVSDLWLGLWAVLAVMFLCHRFWIIAQYRSHYRKAEVRALSRFFRRNGWSWPAGGIGWALLSFLYLDQVPLPNQFICIIVLVGMGAFAVSFVASRLDYLYYYVDGLCGTLLLAELTSWFLSSRPLLSAYDIAFVSSIVTFWIMLRSAGARFHYVHRRGYELQYDNERLITSLQEQTQTAMQAVKVKNGLLAHAAHDLRQPVHALAFYADWLRNEPELSAEVMPKILVATDSVNALFNSLFDFAKIEAGGVKPQFSALKVCELIDDMRVQFNPSAAAKNISFRQRIVPCTVWTDALLIRRIVGNLLGNAIRYTERGGVLLATRMRPGWLWIEVWDTGVGIAPEHHGLVFQEFYKAKSHEGTEEGFGLGLAIVQRLAEALGHRISFVSRPNRGTYMRLEVKLANPAATGPVR